ncbi:ribosomal protein L21-like protein [Microdochium trichocladiopsis]|uniref:Large ribosomal subunit protein bL21m n=1 Tax=Microdochium trichocladiopsis TaxID=1682393 RepID=A0A9P8Y0D2_9PEZI|nr:ribosomal protein L21-like protein [Microdochium trichocladiopsis]KAH7026479.1 ribosomal protein L21-like protein [Microdochium trichocladiopsis]
MSRSILRSVLELRTPITRLPPSYLLPTYARSISSTAKAATPAAATAPASSSSLPPANPPAVRHPPSLQTSPAPTPSSAKQSITELLPLLRAQPNHYITAHIHGFPYLVTEGDQVRLPFRMPGVLPGDVLRLNRASVLGSRDYTLKGEPYIDEGLFECRATVLGTESEPLRVKIKTKRRNRRSQRVTSKHKYTILRISELKVV